MTGLKAPCNWLTTRTRNFVLIMLNFCVRQCCVKTYIRKLDKHKNFSFENIRLRLKRNKQPLDIPIKGVAFPSDFFGVLPRTIDGSTTRHLPTKMVRGGNFGVKGQRTSLRASASAVPSVGVASWAVSIILSQFCHVLAVANTGSCVSLQNKIGHPAGCRFPCWVPAEYK